MQLAEPARFRIGNQQESCTVTCRTVDMFLQSRHRRFGNANPVDEKFPLFRRTRIQEVDIGGNIDKGSEIWQELAAEYQPHLPFPPFPAVD